MGNEANSIHQQSTTPQLSQVKAFTSALSHLPRGKYTGHNRVSFGSDVKKSLPKLVSDRRKCGSASMYITDTEKEDSEKVVKSNSSKGSWIGKFIESSFEDSSSIIVIERLAKNCKLVVPSPLQNMEYARVAAREWRKKKRLSGDRAKVIDLLEYSPGDQKRKQTNAKSVLGDFLLFTNDELGPGDVIFGHSTSTDRFSFGDSANYPKYPSFVVESNECRRISTTAMLPGYLPSDSVAINWPQGSSPEDSVKHLNCVTCGPYTGLHTSLIKTEYNRQAQRVDFTSKFDVAGTATRKTAIFDHCKAKIIG